MKKLLTIAIPTYNRAYLLDKQLSWLAQDIQGFKSDCEIFISDNCSTDHTQEVINKWQEIFTNISFVNHTNLENIGLKKNIALCVESAKTKYVWTIGDDDHIQHGVVEYVVNTLQKNNYLSLLFLNFYGSNLITGQPQNPSTIVGNRWFDADVEEDGSDGKAIFEYCCTKSLGAVIFITASVYRTDLAQQALQGWKNATDNWLFLAYVAGYCALNGKVFVTKNTYIECVIGVSHWQQETAVHLLWQYKHEPEVLMKLKEIGYSREFCNRMIFENFKVLKLRFLLGSFRKYPILTVKTVIYFLRVECLTAWEMKNFKEHVLVVFKELTRLEKIRKLISSLKSDVVYRLSLLKHASKLPKLDECGRSIVAQLKQEGICVTTLQDLNLSATSELLKASSELLPSIKPFDDKRLGRKWPGIYTVTGLSNFYDWGKQHRLLNIIENYVGLPVSYHGAHLRKDFPNEKQFATLLWHRDSEDRHIVKIIIYLSDVREEHGPFECAPKSMSSIYHLNYWRIQYQLWRARRRGELGISNEVFEQIIPKSAWKSFPGPAGTVIFVDTGVLFHHGTLKSQERSTQFFVYTANPPKRPELCTQYWDDTFPKPDLEVMSTLDWQATGEISNAV